MRTSDYPSAAVRIRVMKRDRFQCTYCGAPGTDAELEVDHIIPKSRGGSNHMSNLTTACRKCNQSKSDGVAPARVEAANYPKGLVGMYIHILNEEGRVENQGQIIGIDHGVALVQRYSFFDGCTTNIIPLPVASVINDKACRLYLDAEEMDFYWKHEGGRQ